MMPARLRCRPPDDITRGSAWIFQADPPARIDPEKITFRDDADQFASLTDDRESTELLLQHRVGSLRNGRVGFHRDDFAGHDLVRVHRYAPGIGCLGIFVNMTHLHPCALNSGQAGNRESDLRAEIDPRHDFNESGIKL
jgi:hypothetical protein